MWQYTEHRICENSKFFVPLNALTHLIPPGDGTDRGCVGLARRIARFKFA